MPSTVRLAISMRDVNNYVNENLDDVTESQGGRHTVLALTENPSIVMWPSTGETSLYLKMPQQPADYQLVAHYSIWSNPVTAFIFTILAGTGFVPLIIPKPGASNDQTGAYYYQLAVSTGVTVPTLSAFFF